MQKERHAHLASTCRSISTAPAEPHPLPLSKREGRQTRRPGIFTDESRGSIKRWHRDFGEGTTSTEPNLVYRYREAGKYIVVLNVEGPAGEARVAKVWNVAVK